jgi:hypothetical protein
MHEIFPPFNPNSLPNTSLHFIPLHFASSHFTSCITFVTLFLQSNSAGFPIYPFLLAAETLQKQQKELNKAKIILGLSRGCPARADVISALHHAPGAGVPQHTQPLSLKYIAISLQTQEQLRLYGTMTITAYNTQNHWVHPFCPSSGILNTTSSISEHSGRWAESTNSVMLRSNLKSKKGVVWDVTQCGSCKSRRFGET